MPKVVTPFNRKHHTTAQQANPTPRHRRDGYFDEQDEWHDSSERTDSAANSGS